MPLIEKEIIAPGTYFYTDEKTGLPRKLDVTPELNNYWLEQGKEMLAAGLTIPVPYEHDFSSHPMTPKDKLLNNAGWVADYRIKDFVDPVRGPLKDVLFGVVDVQDEEIARKLPRTIRWTSPWINSFTDGQGKEWRNVISHLALTTRPRIAKQAPFGSIAAALSMAQPVGNDAADMTVGTEGFCLSRAGRLFTGKNTGRLRPRYPMAFSLMAGGIALGDEAPPKEGKKKGPPKPGGKPGEGGGKPGGKPGEGAAKPPGGDGAEEDDGFGGDLPDGEKPDFADKNKDGVSDNLQEAGPNNPMMDGQSDVAMEEILCDLLQALGVPMPNESNEAEFKRHLYEAAMSKIKELTSKGMGENEQNKAPDQNKPPSQQPNASQPNPLVQQEQQPMYMSLEDIQKITDPTTKNVALSMYNENVKANAERDAMKKKLEALESAKLKEADAKRLQRVTLLGKVSPKVKTDLEAMLALPAMALSMGDGGVVIDPMEQTLVILERGLSDMPQLLTTPSSALSVSPHPTDDANAMTEEQENALVDQMVRYQGGVPIKRSA